MQLVTGQSTATQCLWWIHITFDQACLRIRKLLLVILGSHRAEEEITVLKPNQNTEAQCTRML